MDRTGPGTRSVSKAVVVGIALGVLLTPLGIFAALLSAGAGHGHHIAARALFPLSMLLTLLEGRIGAVSIAVALLQFPLYGGLLGWAYARRNYLPAALVASMHLIAAMVCFAGTLPNFS